LLKNFLTTTKNQNTFKCTGRLTKEVEKEDINLSSENSFTINPFNIFHIFPLLFYTNYHHAMNYAKKLLGCLKNKPYIVFKSFKELKNEKIFILKT
jgi:hypothetical protein